MVSTGFDFRTIYKTSPIRSTVSFKRVWASIWIFDTFETKCKTKQKYKCNHKSLISANFKTFLTT